MNQPMLKNATVLFCFNLLCFISANCIAIAGDDSPAPVETSTDAAEKSSDLLKIGSPAAPLSIEHWVSDGRGKFKPATDLQDGKVYVVEFWATWCGPCIGSMPHLAAIQTKYIDQNVQVISISDEDLETVEKFLQRDYEPSKTKTDKNASEKNSESTPKTYAELTSAYCLTTDPDQSVYNDYHAAAGRRGIPSAFIVGKTGLIEWMGHPMKIDEALKAVVNDKWDRTAFATGNLTKQSRDLMTSRISKMLRSGPLDEADKAIDQAMEDFADDELAMSKLKGMKSYIITTPIYDSFDAGENTKALALIEELSPTVNKTAQRQLLGLQVQLQLRESQFDAASQTLALVASDDSFKAIDLVRIVREIITESKSNKNIPQAIFVDGVTLAKKSVDKDGDNSYFLSSLARMQSAAGDLDGAIKTQTKAVANSDGRNKGYQVALDQLIAEKAAKQEKAK